MVRSQEIARCFKVLVKLQNIDVIVCMIINKVILCCTMFSKILSIVHIPIIMIFVQVYIETEVSLEANSCNGGIVCLPLILPRP